MCVHCRVNSIYIQCVCVIALLAEKGLSLLEEAIIGGIIVLSVLINTSHAKNLNEDT